jgi:hypothetical protein
MIHHRSKRDPKPAKKRARKKRRAQPEPIALDAPPPTETAEQALVHIAQDAVVILRRELSWRATLRAGSVLMSDCIALLRLAAELGAAAKRGAGDEEQQLDYSRLSPGERVQLAALLLKVDYV